MEFSASNVVGYMHLSQVARTQDDLYRDLRV